MDLKPIVEVVFSLLPKLLADRRLASKLPDLCLFRDELRNKKEWCQSRAKMLKGEITTHRDVDQALFHRLRPSHDEWEQILENIKRAEQIGTERSRHLLKRIDIPPTFLYIVYDLGWYTYFDQVLSSHQNLLASRRSLSRNQVKPINQVRLNYENLKQIIASNIKDAIREARDEGKIQHCVMEELLLIKLWPILRDNDIIRQSVHESIDKARNLIVQITSIEKERNCRLPDDLFVELVVYHWRDYLLSELEDRLVAKAA
jgi:hypothetical protein